MSTRKVTALAVGSIVLIAGCSDGGTDAKSDARTATTESSPTVSAPTFSKFADFPGKDFVTVEPGTNLGVRVKGVDTVWTPELAGKSADPGKHFVAVYVAVTGELADRGVEKVKLDYLRLKFTSTTQKCGPRGDRDVCHFEAYPSTRLEQVADGEWRNTSWTETISGTDLERGETKIGVIGFSLPDTETATSFELCGPTKDARVDYDRFPCAPIKAPDRTAS